MSKWLRTPTRQISRTTKRNLTASLSHFALSPVRSKYFPSLRLLMRMGRNAVEIDFLFSWLVVVAVCSVAINNFALLGLQLTMGGRGVEFSGCLKCLECFFVGQNVFNVSNDDVKKGTLTRYIFPVAKKHH